MRVITGSAKGRKLKAPKGMTTRPTTDRVKEAMFNILGSKVLDANVLDLFAGTGALAIEALSRGAQKAVIVDTSFQAIHTITENLSTTRLSGQANVVKQDVYHFIRSLKEVQLKYSLIFLDPPYYQGHEVKILDLIESNCLLEVEGLVVVESGKKDILPQQIGNLVLQRRENYGDTSLNFYSWHFDGE